MQHLLEGVLIASLVQVPDFEGYTAADWAHAHCFYDGEQLIKRAVVAANSSIDMLRSRLRNSRPLVPSL